MDQQQAKILLEKINALQKSIHLDQGEVASIERDLMLSYIRQLYEAYLDTETTGGTQRPAPKTYSRPTPPLPPPPPAPAPQPEPVKVVAPAPPPAPVAAPTPPPAPAPTPKATVAAVRASPAIESLFKTKTATELSEKLGQQNISDLTRALSINDKLLYANELFGRDMASMNQTLQQLNGLSSMEEAKAALVATAEKFDWSEEERSDVASSFIKMVRRKY